MHSHNYSRLAFETTCRIVEIFFHSLGLDESEYEVRQMDEESIVILLTGEESNKLLKSPLKFSLSIQHIVRKSIYEKLKFKRPLFISCQRGLDFKKSFESLTENLEKRPPSPKLSNKSAARYHSRSGLGDESHEWQINLTNDAPQERLSHHRPNDQNGFKRHKKPQGSQINDRKKEKSSLGGGYARGRQDSPMKTQDKPQEDLTSTSGQKKPMKVNHQGAGRKFDKNQKRFRTPWKKSNLLDQERKEKTPLEDTRLFTMMRKD
jgi:hypothetical protein